MLRYAQKWRLRPFMSQKIRLNFLRQKQSVGGHVLTNRQNMPPDSAKPAHHISPHYFNPRLIISRRSSHSYTIHSCIACSSTPIARRTSCSCSRSESSAHQASPQPAEICLGTGISLPGAFRDLQAFSIAMASAVVWNVTTSFNVFLRITQSQAQFPCSARSFQKQNSAVSFPPVLLSP